MVNEMTDEKKHLIQLTKAVNRFIRQLDIEMEQPSSPERGKRIAALSNDLCLANDIAKHFGLDISFKSKKFKGE